jgi:phosphate transport system substrate-binding protein
MNRNLVIAIVIIAVVVVGVVGYAYLTPSENVSLSGSGATFPVPLLDAMIDEYGTVKSNVLVSYEGIGSGGGISALQGKTVDFAGSGAPLELNLPQTNLLCSFGSEVFIRFP